MTEERVPTGLAVIINREGKILLGKRKNAHGAGSLAFPGGAQRFSETHEECAKREVREETGLEIANLRKFAFTDDIFTQENQHWTTLYFKADYVSGEAEILEPDKCEYWKWFSKEILPPKNQLMLTIQNLLKQGYDLFD